MNQKLQKLIEPKAGLNFLVPSQWIHQFFMLNQEYSGDISTANMAEFSEKQLQKLYVPYYDPNENLDTFLLEYKSQIIEQINHKCNFLDLKMSIMSLQPSQSCNWTVISSNFWNLIKSKLEKSQAMIQATFTYLNQVNQTHNYPQIISTCQVQIVFCSKSKEQVTVFIGYLPKNSLLINVVQEVGNYLGFSSTYQTKLSFPAKNNEQVFSLYQIQLKNMSLQSASDNLILVFKMEKQQHKGNNQQKTDRATHMEVANQFWETLGQQTAGYRNIPQHGTNRSNSNIAIINDGTQSTGADSYFSFQQAYFNPINQNCQNFSEGNQTFRIPQLLKNLQQEDVHVMKIRANQAIHGILLQIPNNNQQKMQEQLQLLAEQIISSGDFKKKKSPMPMSLQKPQKGWQKLQNSNSEIISRYGQRIIDQSEDTEN